MRKQTWLLIVACGLVASVAAWSQELAGGDPPAPVRVVDAGGERTYVLPEDERSLLDSLLEKLWLGPRRPGLFRPEEATPWRSPTCLAQEHGDDELRALCEAAERISRLPPCTRADGCQAADAWRRILGDPGAQHALREILRRRQEARRPLEADAAPATEKEQRRK